MGQELPWTEDPTYLRAALFLFIALYAFDTGRLTEDEAQALLTMYGKPGLTLDEYRDAIFGKLAEVRTLARLAGATKN